MIQHNRPTSFGLCVVFGSVACMGASLALAQRGVDPQRHEAATDDVQQRRESPRRDAGVEPHGDPGGGDQVCGGPLRFGWR